MGCVNPKSKRTPVAIQQPTIPSDVAMGGSGYYNQQSTVTRTAVPMPNGSHMFGPPPSMVPVNGMNSTMMQNSMVKVPPLQPAYQPPSLTVSKVTPPLEIARQTTTVRQPAIVAPILPNVGLQPLIKQGGQTVDVPPHLRQAARNMNFTPVHINPMGGPVHDVNSNYAMETTQVGGINTIMDQRVMDLDMDMGTSHQTPKIYTYTYGNMMSTGGPLIGGMSGARAAAY